MYKRTRIKQTTTLDARLCQEAKRCRDRAEMMLPSLERDHLLLRARHVETAAHMADWLSSPRSLSSKV
jgi:hypothetical protein